MYAIRLDWAAACRKFAILARSNVWMTPYHYFMATGKIVKKTNLFF